MGSYLSEPVTEKQSSDEANDKLNCGSSSMQGWRVSQEDAHNCLLDFDANTSFFAVYDGHGGHEVAQYCSQKLPQFIMGLEAYKKGEIEQALIEGFLGFDATIASREVVALLKEIAGEKEAEEESDEEENVDNLYKEAAMPIEQVIEQYTNLVNPAVKNLKKLDSEKPTKSPYLKAKKDADAGEASSSSGDPVACKSSSENDSVSSSSTDNGITKMKEEEEEQKVESNFVPPVIKVTSSDSTDSKEATPGSAKPENSETETPIDGKVTQNGEVTDSQPKSDVTSSTPQENGEVESKGKGKAIAKKGSKTPVPSRPKRNAKMLYKTLLDFGQDSEEDSEDEEDKTFEGPNEPSSDDDDDEAVNSQIEGENSDNSSGGEEEEDEEGEEEEDEEEEAEDDEDLEFAKNMKEEPGSDSGCTAVVALLKGNELFVANAGDSRCIVCRNGKAVEMSFDHKPEDEPERTRIVNAGGKVTSDGRVNGGLNLSRAIGDHAYKQNKELSDKEQMITALPDVKTLTINPGEDEFMVLACDGIWNFMSSQEVVDFVRPRMETCGGKLSTICEEMFEHCLAPDTMCDGTGCDNMTAIIVQFKTNMRKRSASPEPEQTDSTTKRAKTDDNSQTQSAEAMA